MSGADPEKTSHLKTGAGLDQETRLISRVAFGAFSLNLGLAVMKGVLAFHSNSVAVTAGAIDSATDAAASLALYAGLRLSIRKSASFPLGLYKIENLISVIVAFFIFFAGYEMAREILSPSAPPPEISALLVFLLAGGTAATFFFGEFALRVGRRTESPSLIAEGRHRRADVLSSLVVLASVLPAYLGWEFTPVGISPDKVAGSLVLVFIAHAGWGLLSDGMRVLLDASIDFETLDKIKRSLMAHPMVVDVRSLIGRNAGRFRFLQAGIVLRTGDLHKAHQISEQLEAEIRRRVPHVEKVTIHYEPEPRTHMRIAVPLADASGAVSDHFGEAPFFGFYTFRLADRRLEHEEVTENPHRHVETAKGLRVAEWLVQRNVNAVFVREDLSGKGPGYVLGNAGVRLSVTAGRDVREVLDGCILGPSV